MNYIENLLQGQKVEWKTLGELGEFYGGLTGKNKNDFSEGNAKYVTYVNVFKNPALNFDINDFVKINKSENQNKIQYGDILFTGSSETPDECGMSSVVNKKVEEDIYLNSFCFGFRLNEPSEFDPDFLKHIFRSFELRKQIGLTANGVTRFNVSKKRMEKVKIPIPPLSVQKEIANILDKFNELEKELDKELELRKKQYKYYRNNLLSFNEIGG
ncbi:restriction endonuclease subunit S [Bergeyella zoohelcum]|uniref:Type I restriction modification DNA specificity domain-containing protein n=1 Tax=Bergeyella zoohelcum TaxID=1015 RepID=A0A7Z8YQK8_9FLAO|nr:restriction endonuclease subunit S [Bergeyella zoohelcum]VDH05118.1 type I restriction modification DNA specificity domain-containing protein [Bergeyella zoohelcum]